MNWVYDNMLQTPYPEDVVQLFPYSLQDEQGRLSVVSGWDLEALQERLNASRSLVHQVFKPMSMVDFREILQREEDFGA